MDAAEAAVQAGYPTGAAAVLIVELRGRGRAGCRGVRAADARSSRHPGPRTHVSPPTRTTARGSGRAASARSRRSDASARISSSRTASCRVPVSARRWRRSKRLSRAHGIRVANVFHAGDGNLHPLILYDGREAGAHDRAEVLAAEILRLCIRLGGSITGEHGVGLEKRAVPRRDVQRGGSRLHAADPCSRWIRTGLPTPARSSRRLRARCLLPRPASARTCRASSRAHDDPAAQARLPHSKRWSPNIRGSGFAAAAPRLRYQAPSADTPTLDLTAARRHRRAHARGVHVHGARGHAHRGHRARCSRSTDSTCRSIRRLPGPGPRSAAPWRRA